jgi:DNA-binding transcriptional LysR family regulator
VARGQGVGGLQRGAAPDPLVAPDLRAVVAAVAGGVGISLLPSFACSDALASGSVVEVHPVADLAPVEPWFACTRTADLAWEQLNRFVADLAHSVEG